MVCILSFGVCGCKEADRRDGSGGIKIMGGNAPKPKPEYLVCAKCGNHLVQHEEYFYLFENEVIGKCHKCQTTFNRVFD